MTTYKLPNGDVTDDQTLYQRQWNQLAQVITDVVLPQSRLASFDPNLTFDVAGHSLTLPVWFVQAIAKNTSSVTGKKFRLKEARVSNCEMCKATIHTMGAGRTRRFCSDCLLLRKKGIHRD